MDDPELDKLLAQLHQEIEKTSNVGDKEQALLRDLSGISAISSTVRGQPKAAYPDHRPTLGSSIDLLEISHPNLTAMMTRLLAILSNAGI